MSQAFRNERAPITPLGAPDGVIGRLAVAHVDAIGRGEKSSWPYIADVVNAALDTGDVAPGDLHQRFPSSGEPIVTLKVGAETYRLTGQGDRGYSIVQPRRHP